VKRLRRQRTAGGLESLRTRLHLRRNSSNMSYAATPSTRRSSAVGGGERVVGAEVGHDCMLAASGRGGASFVVVQAQGKNGGGWQGRGNVLMSSIES
jgi:hypothetical protein